jgi:AbiTii
MLADDIISLLSDEKSSLSEALLKTKVFLYQIGKKELAEWVNHELNSYPDGT